MKRNELKKIIKNASVEALAELCAGARNTIQEQNYAPEYYYGEGWTASLRDDVKLIFRNPEWFQFVMNNCDLYV